MPSNATRGLLAVSLLLGGCALCTVTPNRTEGLVIGQARCGVMAVPTAVETAVADPDASPAPTAEPTPSVAMGIQGGALSPNGYEFLAAVIGGLVTVAGYVPW